MWPPNEYAGPSPDPRPLVELPWLRDQIMEAAYVHFGAIFGAEIGLGAREFPDLITPYAAEMARRSLEAIERTAYADGLRAEAALYAPLGSLLDRYEVLICPTVGTRGYEAGDDYADHGIEVGGEVLEDYLAAAMTPPFNIASRCPVLAVPSGSASNGVPAGIQIVGRTYDDVTVFRAGAAYERERPWFDVVERRPKLQLDIT